MTEPHPTGTAPVEAVERLRRALLDVGKAPEGIDRLCAALRDCEAVGVDAGAWVKEWALHGGGERRVLAFGEERS